MQYLQVAKGHGVSLENSLYLKTSSKEWGFLMNKKRTDSWFPEEEYINYWPRLDTSRERENRGEIELAKMGKKKKMQDSHN